MTSQLGLAVPATQTTFVVPQLWQNSDFFPVGPAEYICGGLLGATELCIEMGRALGLRAYDMSYKLDYLGEHASGLLEPRVEMVRRDNGTGRIDLYTEGWTSPTATATFRMVPNAEAFTLRFGEKCPKCRGRHAGKPCRYDVYRSGALVGG